MKKLTKLFILLTLAMVMTLSFAACGEDMKKHDITLGQSVTIEGYKITVDDTYTPVTEKTLDYWTATEGNTYLGIYVKIEVSEALVAPYTKIVDATTGDSNIVIQLEYKGTVCNIQSMPSRLLYSVYGYGDDVVHTMEANKEYNFPFVFEISESNIELSKAFIYVETATDIYRFSLSA